MKQFFVALFVFGWFFAYKVPIPDGSGAYISTIVGPYKDKATCDANFQESKDLFEQIGAVGMKMQRCVEQKDA